MSTVYRAGSRGREDDLTRILLGNRQREWAQGSRAVNREFEYEGEFEGEGFLNATQLTNAVQANRMLARQIGWGCVIGGGGNIQNDALNHPVRLTPGPSEEDITQAIERWDVANPGGPREGKLGQQNSDRLRACST